MPEQVDRDGDDRAIMILAGPAVPDAVWECRRADHRIETKPTMEIEGKNSGIGICQWVIWNATQSRAVRVPSVAK
ncbi:MAG: hypothetical protein JWQ98_2526 [Chlorobi bacterium]|nr:hypothetical protein [Chlorobiota bacterium]